jgi:hypothetical protein
LVEPNRRLAKGQRDAIQRDEKGERHEQAAAPADRHEDGDHGREHEDDGEKR